jgi:transcriptional regulator with XRE-family HTH domain
MEIDQGKRLASVRSSLGLTQGQLGTALGITRQSVWNLEYEKTSISNDKLVQLRNKFSINPSFLLGVSEERFLDGVTEEEARRRADQYREKETA